MGLYYCVHFTGQQAESGQSLEDQKGFLSFMGELLQALTQSLQGYKMTGQPLCLPAWWPVGCLFAQGPVIHQKG